MLSGNPPNLEAHRIDLPSPAPVLSLGFRPDPLGLPGGTLTLGTSDGVYQAALDELVSAQLAPGPTHIAETAGDIIERIAISSYNSRAEAYLSRYYLYIRNWNGSNYYVDKTPFFAVVPGRATGLAWDSNGTLYHLRDGGAVSRLRGVLRLLRHSQARARGGQPDGLGP